MNKLTFTSLLISLFISSHALADVAVIVHKDNAQSLNKTMIKRIFLSKIKAFPDGTKLQTAGLPETDPTTLEFNKKVLRKSPVQIKTYWSKLIFTGTGTPTKVYASSKEVIDLVKSNKNAIGFVDLSAVSEEVKVLASF